MARFEEIVCMNSVAHLRRAKLFLLDWHLVAGGCPTNAASPHPCAGHLPPQRVAQPHSRWLRKKKCAHINRTNMRAICAAHNFGLAIVEYRRADTARLQSTTAKSTAPTTTVNPKSNGGRAKRGGGAAAEIHEADETCAFHERAHRIRTRN